MTAQLTTEQSAAVQTRAVSVALSAGAGCGKTHVLTERFISHLDPGADDRAQLKQLIAITFTDAAAREMRSRIRQACYDRLTDELDAAKQDHWLRLLRELDTSRVSTIHAFCTALLRSHAAEAGLDPTFDVLEQGEADVLRLNVTDDVLRQRLEEKDDLTLDLAAAYSLSHLKDQIAALLGRRHEQAFREWLPATREDIAAKAEEMVAAWQECNEGEGFQNCIREIANRAPTDEILRLLEGVTPGRDKFVAAKAELLELLPRLATCDVTSDELHTIRRQAQVQGICSAKDWPSPGEYESYKDYCKSLREAIDKKQPEWDPAAALEFAQLGLKLLRLTGDVVAEYQRRKSAIGKLDFDDQLALAHKLLTDPKNAALRDELSADLRLLLVDEFQDTDPLQIELVKLVCGDGFDAGRLFFVGDFKQSIYRFRGAQPPEFLNLRKEIPQSGRLPLTRNFRSQPGILDFVNALFCNAFGEYDQLRPERTSPTTASAVEFLWTITPNKNANEKGAREAARREEARAIARRLRELVDPESAETPVVDKDDKKPRRARPGDIAILFRALSDVRLYEEALRDEGLDYYLVGGHAFYAQQEIYDVLNLLRAVSSTADEVSLAGALRSPLFALADETLFWLVDSAGSLNGGLLAETLPPALTPEERAKTALAAATIAHLRAIKDRVPIAKLLGEALARTGYDAVLLAEFLGERKLANLQKLMEQARSADGGSLDLNGFITQLAEFIARPPQEPLASTCPETADVIRLMTIHRAKGLEFPLVVVPDLDRPPNPQTPVAALDRKLGPLVPWPSDDDREKSVTGMSLFTAREKQEELAERTRLLYVACTRAADYLILSSSLKDHAEPKSDWMELIAERFDLATGQLIAKLPADYGTPLVHVTPPTDADEKTHGRSRGADLLKVLDDAHRLAALGEGVVPSEVQPIAPNQSVRRQFSFSRLTGRLLKTSTQAADEPASIERAGSSPTPTATIDPRGFGTLVHDVLARIDLKDTASIAEWCEHLAPSHVVLKTAEAARAASELIEQFATSSHGRDIATAGTVYREVEFLLAWPSGQANGNGVYLRGFIDCLFQDAAGRWHLVDFKTNNIPAADAPREAERYAMQLYVYAMAAERTLGQPLAELVLHFLRPGVTHIIPWNDDARRQAIEMVNEAIAQAQDSGCGVQGSDLFDFAPSPEP